MPEFKSPLEFLGFEPGADRKLADWTAMLGYFQQLAAASPRVKLVEAGLSTEGKPFIYLVITSEENMAKLDHYREIQARLADPRGLSHEEAQKLIAEGKSVAMISCGIHATEIGGPQCSITLAYEMAAGIAPHADLILDNVIFLLVPSLNPDGHQMVCDWYYKNLDTQWEGGSMPWLYQKYVGHDNNRDWYMFTQAENRNTVEHIHNVWHPQIVYDMHQMGSNAARIYIPPFIDPIEPNLDPILQQNVIWMGSSMANELTAQGKKGVVIHAMYDAWTPARAYQHSHAGIRILSEVASVRVATPVKVSFEELGAGIGYDAKKSSWNFPEVWPGGDWHFSDIVEYEKIASYACLGHAARYRDTWLRNFYQIGKRAVERTEAPLGIILSKEQRSPLALKALLEVMQFAMVELSLLEEEFEIGGKKYPVGSYVIPANQPYYIFAKQLLEKQAYPDLRSYPGGPPQRPYDVTSHTLNILMGVEAEHLDCIKELKLKPIKELPSFAQEMPAKAGYYLISPFENAAFTCAAQLLAQGFTVKRIACGAADCPAGTWAIPAQEGVEAELAKWSAKGLKISSCDINSPNCGAQMVTQKPVRFGLYKSWTGSMDEGWTRFTLEQFGIPYVSLHNEDITSGNLAEKIDVLMIPSMANRQIRDGMNERMAPPPYAGGLGEAGAAAIKEFVEAGGRLIVSDNSTVYATNIFGLPIDNALVDRNVPEREGRGREDTISAEGRRIDFFVPGSLLKVKVDNQHPLTWGAQEEEAIWFQRSPAFIVDEGDRLMFYPSDNPLVSGWIYDPQQLLRGRCALVQIPVGKGKVAMFGFNPVYRAQAHNLHKFLFNAIFEAGLE
ncbi:MAG: M14 family metallopeptidase [Symbiobacteriaceae bacterium]|nr:M14 family metallopeptidase [Symbiobacteriaceae bacterium]